ncbi:MAG: Rid family detoxifying hydrolase [Erysipelotrichaceae bacterium]|nr:Rid family detoxifying hydrolase [Erysipelotrichaceae bacterium]MDY6035173.1 Rid family detoxifying hydrolase [Bulleidia sp.]
MIQELISSSKVPLANGPFSSALRSGDFIYLSGQLPIDPDSGNLVEGDIKVQTERVLNNINNVLEEIGLNMSYVLKTTVYLKKIDDLQAVNEEYVKHFKNPFPTRSVVSVSDLPMGALVQIEAFAIDTRALELLCAQDSCVSCNDIYCETKLDIQ